MEKMTLIALDEVEFKTLLKESIKEVLTENADLSGTAQEQPWDIEQAGYFLKMKKNTIYEKTSAKIIPHYKKGNTLYFFRSELELWIKEGKVKTNGEVEGEAASFRLKKEVTK